MPNIKQYYRETVVPQMMTEFKYKNVMQVPRIVKVNLNVGVGEAIDNAKALDGAVEDIIKITGQKPVIKGQEKHRHLQAAGGPCHRGQGHAAQ
jgi:large subunit ribosomal protein L5